ncbi:acetyltransferase [Gracilibacillus marinus]|uniref:Acetyltransferase n=1 Tax=Gracilibacillus marinus TaxID=630535 RepID=A0ABV8VRE2_9BACI
MEDILLIGGGGHCRSVIDSIQATNQFNIVGILDTKDNIGKSILGVEIVGEDKDMALYRKKGIQNAFNTIGSTGDIRLRYKISQLIINEQFHMPNIIDPTAIVSDSTTLGSGIFIGKGAIVNVNASLCDHVIVNSGAIVEHDVTIESYCHIAPGTTISGGVFIGEGTHIGTNSTIIQGVQIGSYCLIGAGSVVVKNIDDNKKAFGNPCKEVGSNE